LRGLCFEKFSACGGRGWRPSPPRTLPLLQESAPQTNSEHFSFCGPLTPAGRGSKNEAYQVAQKMQRRIFLAIGGALKLTGLDFEKFSACGGRGGDPVHQPPGPPPPTPLPESAPQTNSNAIFSLWAAAAGRSQSIRGRASRDEAYPGPKTCNKESFWQSGRPLI